MCSLGLCFSLSALQTDERLTAYLPEPKDDGVVGAVAVLVLGVLPPVVHVHVSQPTHEQLKESRPRQERLVLRPMLQLQEGDASISLVETVSVLYLQLVLIKYLDEVLWYDFIKALC